MSEKDLVLSMQGNESMEDSAEVFGLTFTVAIFWSTISNIC